MNPRQSRRQPLRLDVRRNLAQSSLELRRLLVVGAKLRQYSLKQVKIQPLAFTIDRPLTRRYAWLHQRAINGDYSTPRPPPSSSFPPFSDRRLTYHERRQHRLYAVLRQATHRSLEIRESRSQRSETFLDGGLKHKCPLASSASTAGPRCCLSHAHDETHGNFTLRFNMFIRTLSERLRGQQVFAWETGQHIERKHVFDEGDVASTCMASGVCTNTRCYTRNCSPFRTHLTARQTDETQN